MSEDGTAALVGPSNRIPRFIRVDRDLQAVAAAIALGSTSRSMQNILSIGSGCPGTGVLTATSNGPDIHLIASGLPSRVYSVFVYGPPLGNPVPFYDGQLCAAWGPLQRMSVRLTSLAGSAEYAGPIQPNPGVNTISVQCIYRDPAGFYGGNLTNGLLVNFEPLP